MVIMQEPIEVLDDAISSNKMSLLANASDVTYSVKARMHFIDLPLWVNIVQTVSVNQHS